MNQSIIEAAHQSINTIIQMFQAEPTRYFTENDLVCSLHRLLHQSLEDRGVLADKADKDGLPHGLVHCEYPTPFRCNMNGTRFEIKTDDDKTDGGRKFKRGHYDLVILNDAFVRSASYNALKAQDFSLFRSSVLPLFDAAEPIILFGIEIVFCRNEIKPSRGANWERAALEFVAGVQQDTAKLRASLGVQGFMGQAIMLAFIKGTSGRVLELISRSLQGDELIKLTIAL